MKIFVCLPIIWEQHLPSWEDESFPTLNRCFFSIYHDLFGVEVQVMADWIGSGTCPKSGQLESFSQNFDFKLELGEEKSASFW